MWLGPPFPQRFMVLTLIGGLVGGETLKDKMKMEKVREMGAPSSYLLGLLYNPSFAPGYK
jgi:hypothetical protein